MLIIGVSFEDSFESSGLGILIAPDESLIAFLDYFLNLMTNTATCLSQLGLSTSTVVCNQVFDFGNDRRSLLKVMLLGWRCGSPQVPDGREDKLPFVKSNKRKSISAGDNPD